MKQKHRGTVYDTRKHDQLGPYRALNDRISQPTRRMTFLYFFAFLILLLIFYSALFFHSSYRMINSS